MKDLKIKIINKSQNYTDYITQSTGLFYKLYNNAELMEDKIFKNDCKLQFPLLNDVNVYRTFVIEVKMLLSQKETIVKNKEAKLKILNSKLSECESYEKPKIIQKIAFIERTINKDICFGGKNLLRKITKISQEIQYRIHLKSGKNLTVNDLIKKQNLLIEYKSEFTENRSIGYYSIGDSYKYGNRKFSFDLNNRKVIFKPKFGIKIEIEFCNTGKNWRKDLERIQFLSENKGIPITVRLTNEYLHIIYDNELLNGYNFNSKEYRKRRKLIPKTDESRIKALDREFVLEQKQRKLCGKIIDRYMSVDLNPYEIGLVICDANKKQDGIENILFKTVISLSGLSYKLGVSSNNSKQIKQNNKRKYEIKQVWKYIFDLAVHYKVAYFVVEELKFKDTDIHGNEFNRLTKNIWHRTLTMNLISKYCYEKGIIKIGVNPIYSSFIGNLIFNEYDCIASTLELCRRGIVKYIKGSDFFPPIIIFPEKLVYLLENKINIELKSWKQLFRDIAATKLSYRNKDLSLFKGTCLESHKSNVVIFTIKDEVLCSF